MLLGRYTPNSEVPLTSRTKGRVVSPTCVGSTPRPVGERRPQLSEHPSTRQMIAFRSGAIDNWGSSAHSFGRHQIAVRTGYYGRRHIHRGTTARSPQGAIFGESVVAVLHWDQDEHS